MTIATLFMKAPIRALVGLSLAVMGPLTAKGQVDNVQSLYSRFGVGQLYSFSSSQSQALGGAATGIMTVNYLNLSNPAAWSDQVYTRFSAGFEYSATETVDADDNSMRFNSGMLNALQLGFPIQSRRLGMVFALLPYSRVGYRTERKGELPAAADEPGSTYRTIISGNGGLQKVMAGAGYRLSRHLAVGVSADAVFGIIDYERVTQMDALGQFLSGVGTQRSTRLSGVSGTVGLTLVLPSTSEQGSRLTAGAAVSLPMTLNGKQVYQLIQTAFPDTLGDVRRGEVGLPLRGRLGIAYRPSSQFLLAGEGRYEAWERFSSTLPMIGSDSSGKHALRDTWRIGGGVEWSPSGGSFHPNFFRRSLYRVGGYAEQSYYSPDASVDINTVAATAGISMPSLFPGTYVDVNAEIGRRGAISDILVRDLYVNVSATINFGERWFVKRRFR